MSEKTKQENPYELIYSLEEINTLRMSIAANIKTQDKLELLAMMAGMKTDSLLEFIKHGKSCDDPLEAVANARLFAAAPDLLAACEAIMAKYDAAPDGALGIGLVNGDFFRLRDAIKKARGEA
jgi:hypothetical protein